MTQSTLNDDLNGRIIFTGDTVEGKDEKGKSFTGIVTYNRSLFRFEIIDSDVYKGMCFGKTPPEYYELLNGRDYRTMNNKMALEVVDDNG